MLKKILRIGVAFSYIALANYCFICAVKAEMHSPMTDSGHCPMSTSKKSCCDETSSNTKSSSDEACSYSMDNSAAVLKIVDTSVTPVFVQIGSLVPLTPVEAELDPIILKQSHGPPFSLLALGFDYPPLLGRSPPFLS